MKYRPDIDGLRSVAVIPVILFHLAYSWIIGGYFGVDVFFVISGYLIASIYTGIGASPFFDLTSSGEPGQKQDRVRGFPSTDRWDCIQSFLTNLDNWKPKSLIASCRWEILSEENRKCFFDFIGLVKYSGTTVMILRQPPVVDVMGNRNSAQYFTFLDHQPNGRNQYIQFNSNYVIESNNRFRKQFGNISNIVFLMLIRHLERIVIRSTL